MAKRERAADRSKRPANVTAKSIAAGKANLAKGRAARDAIRAQAAEEEIERDTGAMRWAKLLDGTLAAKDLDDQELSRMQVRGKDGSFNGPRPAVPSHLIQAMQKEAIKRAQDKFRAAAPEAVALLVEIGSDPDIKVSDRVNALKFVVERALGRMPETIRVEGANKFDEMLDAALGVPLDRDVAAEPEASEQLDDSA